MEMLNEQELDHLARLAHDLGWDAATDEPENTPAGEIEQAGQDTLARIIASLGTKEMTQLFLANFRRGWLFEQTGSRDFEERITDLP